MIIFNMFPVIISCMLIGAHFLRAGSFGLLLVSVAIPFLLFVRRRWAARFVQIFLVIAAIEWLRTLFGFIDVYESIGQSWTRMAIILGSVAAFTFSSAFVFFGKRVKERYQ
jgi:hypothetical protein